MSTDGYFKYNGVDIRNISGVYVYRNDLYGRPTRGYQVINPPGRMGSVIRDNMRYPNVEMVYDILIKSDFDTKYRQIRNMLLGVDGYARLEDAWNPDEFYQAYVSAPLEPRVSVDREKGEVTVVFSRRPERWLKSGETLVKGAGGNITNPTKYNAYPYATITLDPDKIAADRGTQNISDIFRIGRYNGGDTTVINVSDMFGDLRLKGIFQNITSVAIDCASGDIIVTPSTADLRQYIYIFDTDIVYARKYLNRMPFFSPGTNYYSFSWWISSVAVDSNSMCVMPRWYTI